MLFREVAQARHEVARAHSIPEGFKTFNVEIIKIYKELQRYVEGSPSTLCLRVAFKCTYATCRLRTQQVTHLKVNE